MPDETMKKSESQIDQESARYLENPRDEIQVPGTAPVREYKSMEKQEELSAQNPAEAEDEESLPVTEEDPDAELPPFYWEEFRDRYHAQINAINEEEDAIMKHFDIITQASTYMILQALYTDRKKVIWLLG